MTIEKIKTHYGVRYAVRETFTYKKNINGTLVPVSEKYAVEYSQGGVPKVAIFPVTPEGLKEAKELMASFKKNKKK